MKKNLSIVLVLSMLLSLFSNPVFAVTANENVVYSDFPSVEESYYTYIERPKAAAQADYSGAVAAISNAIAVAADSVNLSTYGILTSQMSEIINNQIYQNPAFFYLSGITYSYNTSTNVLVNVFFAYYYNTTVIQQMKANYETAITKALLGIKPEMSNAEKVLAMHDYLILNAKYDYENYLDGTIPRISHTAYGVMVLNVGVCDGYALAFKDLMTRLGIPVVNLMSSTMSHAWNMVSLDGKWYHVDVSSDDPAFDAEDGWYNNDYDLEGSVRHEYFLLSDSAIGIDHSGWSPSSNIANSKIYDGKYANIKSGMFWYQGYWYYNTGGSLTRSLFNLSGSSVLKTVNGYDNNYSFLGVFNNEIYYNITASNNSISEIRKCKFDGSSDTGVLLINNAGQTVKEKITEFVIQNGIIKYTVYRWPASGSAQYAVRYYAFVVRESSATLIDPETDFIYSLKTGLTSTDFENNYVRVSGNTRLEYESPAGVLGTGTKVKLVDKTTQEVLATYTILIFGDVNGDGNVDSLDAGLMIDFENYRVEWDAVTDAAVLKAGDLDGNGKVESTDAGTLVDAENHLININQKTGLAG